MAVTPPQPETGNVPDSRASQTERRRPRQPKPKAAQAARQLFVSRFRMWLRRIASALALAAVGIAYFVPGRPRIPLVLLAAAGSVQFLSVLVTPRTLLRWVTHRPYLYRATNFLYAVAGTTVVVAAVGLVDRAGLVWDLGARGRIVIAEATVLAARSLPGPPEVRYYPAPGIGKIELQRSVDLLRDLEARVPGSRVHILDPIREVEAVVADGMVMGGPDVVVETAGRAVRMRGVDEARLRSTFERLAHGGGVVCALGGHGERDPTDPGPRGLSLLVGVLEARGWSLTPVPGDLTRCEVVLVAGADHGFPAADLERLSLFLDDGGRMMALVEPGIETGLEPLLAARGIDVLAGTLRRDVGPSPLTVRGIPVDHPMFGGAGTGVHIWAHGAVPIGVRGDAEALVWTEPHINAVEELSSSPGPFVMVAASRWVGRGERSGRVVVFADVDVATNRALAEGGNQDLLESAMRWLVADEADDGGGDAITGISALAPGAWAFVAIAFLMLGFLVQRRWERA